MYFSDVIGQEKSRRRLLQMVAENRVPHALMLCGPEGCGKMALALAFASFLLGDIGPEEDADPELKKFVSGFDQRKRINAHAMLAKWEHPDLHFSFPVVKLPGQSAEYPTTSADYMQKWIDFLADGPYIEHDRWSEVLNENKIAVIYEAESDRLQHELMLKSNQGGYKISLIWQPECMNATCANKLLKLLEEPPSKTVFLLVSEDPGQLLETIRSRVQRIDIPRLETEDIENALQQQRSLEPDMAHRVARLANGSWTRALESLDASNEEKTFLDLFIVLMRQAYMRNAKELKKWSLTVSNFDREKQVRMLNYFLRMVRENFIYNFHNPELNYMTQEEENFSKNFARFINEANVIEMSEAIQKATDDIVRNGNAKMVFFCLSLQIIVLIMRK
ncbi:MAG: DNA polymerase III subunit delta [Prevotella sp.]|nr:DNA polymerase III subunit delta [Prevotella sp.]